MRLSARAIHSFVSLCIVACMLPAYATAANAGFPVQALWPSKTAPVGGETIEISTIVYNATNAKLAGHIIFLVDERVIESKETALKPGASMIVSTSWRAVPGEHSFAARFTAAPDAVDIHGEAGTMRLSVAAPPPPSPTAQAITAATTFMGSAASSSAPILTKAAAATYAATESLRERGISALEEYQRESSPQGTVSETQRDSIPAVGPPTSGFAPENPVTSEQTAWQRASQIAAAAALTTLRSKILFYPLLILSIALALSALFRWALRRPSVPQR